MSKFTKICLKFYLKLHEMVETVYSRLF